MNTSANSKASGISTTASKHDTRIAEAYESTTSNGHNLTVQAFKLLVFRALISSLVFLRFLAILGSLRSTQQCIGDKMCISTASLENMPIGAV